MVEKAHTLTVERARFSPLGFTGSYSICFREGKPVCRQLGAQLSVVEVVCLGFEQLASSCLSPYQ